MKNILTKGLIIIIFLAALVGLFNSMGNGVSSRTDGTITIEIFDNNNDRTVYTADYYVGDDMLDILNREGIYIEYIEYSFGVMLTKIGSLDSTIVQNSYIKIFVNDKEAEVGISDLNPSEFSVIIFVLETW